MRILLATDGSSHAVEAAEWLVHFPVPDDAVVEVVTVVAGQAPGRSERWEQAEQVVEDARRRLAKRWPGAGGRILEGDPREAIVEAAARDGADLVALGSRGLGAVTALLLGSVAVGVARHASCPVLVCKGRPRPVRSATLALDGSAGARAALDYFARLTLPAEMSVRLVGVVEPLRFPSTAPGIVKGPLLAALKDDEEERRTALNAVLDEAADRLRPHVRSVATATTVGPPAESIVGEAQRQGSDLIVVGARGLGTFRRVLLGSVSESVLRRAPCPVLVVRPPGGD
jgi:nucleotide-binding universal stress UspA family protein